VGGPKDDAQAEDPDQHHYQGDLSRLGHDPKVSFISEPGSTLSLPGQPKNDPVTQEPECQGYRTSQVPPSVRGEIPCTATGKERRQENGASHGPDEGSEQGTFPRLTHVVKAHRSLLVKAWVDPSLGRM
jgi:hypothetical protein